MSGFIDTNLLVYASYLSFPQQAAALEFINACKSGPSDFFVSWNVIYEFLSVATNPKLFKSATLTDALAMENIFSICTSEFVTILQETSNHRRYLEETQKSFKKLNGAVFHDAHIVALMKEHDIKRIYSGDSDFRLFDGIEVINPLK